VIYNNEDGWKREISQELCRVESEGSAHFLEVANMKVSCLGNFGDIFGKRKVTLKVDALIACRVC